ncbi:MAG: cupin domain-containing protein [Methanomicrobiales archaeon]|nr:cupin domain-containing protein [Methanomicrobiales archaeon]
MEDQDFARCIEDGAIVSPTQGTGRLPPWYSNPEWMGVILADLVPGVDTKDAFSSHLVRIGGGCEVPDHLHESQWEWNVILAGHGKILLDGREVPFKPGDTFSTPPGIRHTVVADEEDVALMAIFVPGLK